MTTYKFQNVNLSRKFFPNLTFTIDEYYNSWDENIPWENLVRECLQELDNLGETILIQQIKEKWGSFQLYVEIQNAGEKALSVYDIIEKYRIQIETLWKLDR